MLPGQGGEGGGDRGEAAVQPLPVPALPPGGALHRRGCEAARQDAGAPAKARQEAGEEGAAPPQAPSLTLTLALAFPQELEDSDIPTRIATDGTDHESWNELIFTVKKMPTHFAMHWTKPNSS